jgi:hypothetical protein
MARARIVLKGALSHDHGDVKYVKGVAQTVDNDAEIDYCRKRGMFSVTMLEDPKPVANAKSAGGPNKPTPAPAKAKATSSDDEEVPD